MKSGIKRPRINHLDRSYHPSFGTTAPVVFPDSINFDAGFWCPDQNLGDTTRTPVIPSMPYGCTNYGIADACSDEDVTFYNPLILEEITHANARGGLDIREALSAAKKVFARTGYYNITSRLPIDPFDSIRIAILSALPEKRVVIMGTPFFPEFQTVPHVSTVGEVSSLSILPTPQDFSLSRATWHCWDVKGYKTINGVPYLLCKMWTGSFFLMSRELCNSLFAIRGSVAYTLTKETPTQIQTIAADLTIVQIIVSYIRNLFHV